jgi:predicted CXXCH cytochrome family protein
MRSGVRVCYLSIGIQVLAAIACAQDIDTAILTHSETRQFTILDQISNPRERDAFTELYREHNSQKRLDLAASFLDNFPDSWLLPQIYEIAAKASLELNQFDAAFNYGARSLRLWPENLLLLVPLANLEAKQKRFDDAERDANKALWCLDRFDRPSSVAKKDWPQVRQSLRASSYFALGRVAAARGFASSGEIRKAYLAEARQDLLHAYALNQADPEITYLLGLTELGLADASAAASSFAETVRLHGPLEAQAFQQLQTLYQRFTGGKPVSFDVFLSSLPPLPKAEPQPSSAPAALQIREYAGSEACRQCHPEQYASWKQTGMARMFCEYRPENVIGNFAGSSAVSDDTGTPAIRALLDKGRHYFEVRGLDNRWIRYPVNYTIGSKWQQAYATRLDDGRIQVFPVQYSLIKNQWLNYWKVIDPPGTERTQIEKFSSGVSEATYQFNCAPCHTSQLRFKNGMLKAEAAAFHEGGINCEMCHGPSAAHVAQLRRSGPYKKPADEPPVDFTKITAAEYISICSQCHLQSGARDPGADGAVNYSPSGVTFYRVSLSRPYVDFSRKAFYKDGRFRITTFIVESFVRSACYRIGQARCGSCHNPHPADPQSNRTSLKFAGNPDEMCLQCHTSLRNNPQAHTHHAVSSEGSRCVSCHMPKIMEAVMFSARSHQVDDIPDAEMTARFGQQESPNACLSCHNDKDAQWLKDKLAAWPKRN